MSTTYTLKNIVERLVNEGAVDEPRLLTATGGSTSTFAATGAAPSMSSSTAYQGRVLWVTYDGAGSSAAPENEARTVTTLSGTTWTVLNVFSAAIASSDLAVMLPPGWSKGMTLDAVNAIISNLKLPRYLSATLVPDGDMEATGVTSWTDATGTPTQTKETSVVLTGTQSLKVVYTVVDTSVGSDNIPVTETEQYSVWAPVKVTAGSMQLQVYDVTNGAEIDATDTISDVDWTIPWLQFSPPSGCKNVSIRIINKTASTTLYVDHVGVLSQQENLLALPSQITDAANVTGIMTLPLTEGSGTGDGYIWGAGFEPGGGFDINRDYEAAVSHRVSISRPYRPTFYEFTAAGTRLASMTDTFYASPGIYEAIIEGSLAEIYKRLKASTTNDARQRTYAQAEGEHYSTYLGLLDKNKLLRPRIQMHPQRRVTVG